jgi:hypothetical protein
MIYCISHGECGNESTRNHRHYRTRSWESSGVLLLSGYNMIPNGNGTLKCRLNAGKNRERENQVAL